MTASVTVAVRALSVIEIDLVGLVRDELIIGLTIGLAMGILTALPVYAVFGDYRLPARSRRWSASGCPAVSSA